MKKIILFCQFLTICKIASAQLAVPYFNNFDNLADTAGWSHYALSGSDDWAIGVPQGVNLNSSLTPPNVWATNLTGNFTQNSIMCLETPYFDLSGTTEYVLTFAHKLSASSNHGGNIEFTVDSGQTWQLLNGTISQKKNWYVTNIPILGQQGWTGQQYVNFNFPAHSLGFLSGQNSVKFRFKFGGTTNSQEGWIIDNFNIIENVQNILALNGNKYEASKAYPNFVVSAPILYQGIVTPTFNNVTEYYFSLDSILDSSDSFLGTKTGNISGSVSNWSTTFNMPPNIFYGDYYIFMKHDAANNLNESNENDNIAYCILHIDSTFVPNYNEDFESNQDWWKPYSFNSQNPNVKLQGYWDKGSNDLYKIYGTHSKDNAWFVNQGPTGAGDMHHCLESPTLDFSGLTSPQVICFWFKAYRKDPVIGNLSIQLSRSSDFPSYYPILGISLPINSTRFNDWDCKCQDLNFLNGHNNSKIRFQLISNSAYTTYANYVVFDDIYIGVPKPDLSIEHNHERTLISNRVIDTLYYNLMNGGMALAPPSVTKFYWSNDSLLDSNDILLGISNEPSIADTGYLYRKFGFTMPTTSTGTYFIITEVDADSTINEMWESNNITSFLVRVVDIEPVPYMNDFESHTNKWRHSSIIGEDEWEWSTPQGTIINQPFSGQKAFVTKKDGIPTSKSIMLLYSPVFDLTGLNIPVLEFDMQNVVNASGNNHPLINMSYSYDNGATWHVLDTGSQSYKSWYYPNAYNYYTGVDNIGINYEGTNFFEPREPYFLNTASYFGRDSKRVTKFILDIQHLKHHPSVQFRFNLSTPMLNLSEGVQIDNFSIKEADIDLTVTYSKPLMISSLSQQIRFFINISNQGNYLSNPAFINYYLSSDSILDAYDFVLGQDSIGKIKPDMDYYVNSFFNAPVNLANYKYLIFNIDVTNTNPENNKTNNIGYWPLSLDSIYNYPYLMDFNDTITDGWNHYAITASGGHYKNSFRIRNMKKSADSFTLNSGEMFTDRISNQTQMSIVPFWYLESPVMNFNSMDSIFLSFDFTCTGRTTGLKDGGNLDFSIDGGNTWTLLTTQHGQATNWYNSFTGLENLHNELGWNVTPFGQKTKTFNASFLRGQSNVVFRFKFRSNAIPNGFNQGMIVDNFQVEGFTADYAANDSMVPVNTTMLSSNFSFNYSISNLGQSNGRPTTTRFYWSTDSIFDPNDPLIHSVSENTILMGTTQNAATNVIYPTPITQAVYYLFYVTDADSLLVETDKTNNLGSFKISFQLYPNYLAHNIFDTISALSSQTSIPVPYSIINNGLTDGVNTTTAFYWSTDAIFDPLDLLVLTVNESAILSGDTLNNLASIIYPSPITQNEYYLFYKADNSENMVEISETDNIGMILVQFNPSNYIAGYYYDTIQALTSNSNILATYSIANNGLSDGENSTTAFFWSLDAVLDPSDMLVWTVNENPILSGDTLVALVNFPFPGPINQTEYYLFYQADYNQEIFETDENDNTGVVVVRFAPANYIATIFHDTINALTSLSTINSPYKILNNGLSDGETSTTIFFWSDDNILDPADPVVNLVNENPILSGDTMMAFITFAYPGPISQTEYYLFYQADNNQEIFETDENDNIGVVVVNFAPANYLANNHSDTIYALTSQPVINTYYTIINNGLSDGEPSTTAFFWSEDSLFGPNDLLLLTINEATIISGDTLSAWANLHFPGPINQADYYLFYITDYSNDIFENNETDNVGSFIVKFSPPNYIAYTLSDTVILDLSQSTIDVNYSIINNGASDGVNSSSVFYWSLDSILDISDPIVHTVIEIKVNAGDTLSTSATLNYPTPIYQNQYYLFFKTDALDEIFETTETDNIARFIVLTALPNYTALNHLDTTYAYLSKFSFDMDYSIRNIGLSDGISSTTAFYWSNDSIFDTNDHIIHSVSEPPILKNDILSNSVSINYPSGISQGTYYLFVKADDLEEIWESDEASNIGSLMVILQNDLSIKENTLGKIDLSVNDKNVFVRINQDQVDELFNFELINLLGQVVFKENIRFRTGLNIIPIPELIASGVYNITVNNKQYYITTKTVITK